VRRTGRHQRDSPPAGKHDVMPVGGSGLAGMIAEKPLVAVPRDSCTYRSGTQSVTVF